MIKPKLFIFFLLFPYCARTQNPTNDLLKVVPPSPTVVSLGKYGDIPVGLYTGVPNISIPIYEINDGGLSLPIGLSYHAGGVKVEEVASNVGLCWTMNAGGIISKNVRGKPDEFGSWNIESPTESVESILLGGNYAKMDQLAYDVEWGIRDGEADIYYYNFGKYSGKFFFDQSGNPHIIPSKNILILPNGFGWSITVEDGTVYSFALSEQVSSSSCGSTPDQTTYTAWFLTSIISSDGVRQITFTYDPVNYSYETLVGQTKYFSYDGTGSLCLINGPPCLGYQFYHTQRLKRIDFANGYLNFIYNNSRCDLLLDKSLDAVEVYNSKDMINRYEFTYFYFGDNSDGCSINGQYKKRLKLVSIKETSHGVEKPPYSFDYNESIALPNRLSYAQDQWGYYNGKITNKDLVATFTTTLSSGQLYTFQGADRKANPQTAQAAILTKIKYPSGGETFFTYESNEVSDPHVEPQTIESETSFRANDLATSLPTPYQSQEIIIPSQGAAIKFNVSGLSDYLWDGCDIVHCYVIKDNNPTPFREIANNWDQSFDSWPAGSYRLKLITECSVNSVANFNITITAINAITVSSLDNKPVGGLRIKQIEDNPNNGTPSKIKKYRYSKENDDSHSSGYLVNNPDFGYDLYVSSGHYDEFGNLTGEPDHCGYRVRQSFSNYPLATTQGSYTGYANVIEDFGENGESRSSFIAFSDVPIQQYPFAPIDNSDWSRGFLLRAKYFSRNNNQLNLVKEIINEPVSLTQNRMYGIKTGRTTLGLRNHAVKIFDQAPPVYSFYPTVTEFFDIGKTTQRTYDQDQPSKFVETVTEYTYHPGHFQLIENKSITSNSDQTNQEEIIIVKKYAPDYIFNGAPIGAGALGIKKLQELHVVNATIEESIIKQIRNKSSNDLSNQRVIGSRIISYKNDKPYPTQVLRFDVGAPIAMNVFNTGSQIIGNAFVKNSSQQLASYYKPEIIFDRYDEKGNIVAQKKANNYLINYIWGYNNRLPVAEFVGAPYADVYALLNQSIIQSPVSDQALRSEINKIRINFPLAIVKSYTYKPLIGITSETDPNGKTSFYDYDFFNRLKLIRDNDKNILKTLEYQYNAQ